MYQTLFRKETSLSQLSGTGTFLTILSFGNFCLHSLFKLVNSKSHSSNFSIQYVTVYLNV